MKYDQTIKTGVILLILIALSLASCDPAPAPLSHPADVDDHEFQVYEDWLEGQDSIDRMDSLRWDTTGGK